MSDQHSKLKAEIPVNPHDRSIVSLKSCSEPFITRLQAVLGDVARPMCHEVGRFLNAPGWNFKARGNDLGHRLDRVWIL